MPRRLFVFEDPERFVAGTTGAPGSRTFFLQVRQAGAVASVSLEKTQVAALAMRLGELLDVLETDDAAEPPVADRPADSAPLDEPVGELFRAGAMSLAWDAAVGHLIVEAQPLSEEATYPEVPDDQPDGPDLMRVRITLAMARDFATRAAQVVGAGRPACPFCGMPLEPTGHFCSRANGQLN